MYTQGTRAGLHCESERQRYFQMISCILYCVVIVSVVLRLSLHAKHKSVIWDVYLSANIL